MEFLSESTPSGEQVEFVDLSRASSVWQSPTTSFDDVDYEAVSFTHTLLMDTENVTFAFSAKLFKVDSTVQYGQQQIAVLKNELEFSINITNWPFRSMENTLTYGITVNSKGGGKSKKGKLPTLDDVRGRKIKNVGTTYSKPQKEALFDTGNLLAPTTAIVDGVEQDITLRIGQKSTQNTLITFTFPAFQSTLYYDPILSAHPGLTWGTIAIMCLGISAIAACFFFFMHKSSPTKHSETESLQFKNSLQQGPYHAVGLSPPDSDS